MSDTTAAHAHCWIDPADPPIQRAPYSPIIGTGPHEMTRGAIYVCRVCGARIRATGDSRTLLPLPQYLDIREQK